MFDRLLQGFTHSPSYLGHTAFIMALARLQRHHELKTSSALLLAEPPGLHLLSTKTNASASASATALPDLPDVPVPNKHASFSTALVVAEEANKRSLPVPTANDVVVTAHFVDRVWVRDIIKVGGQRGAVPDDALNTRKAKSSFARAWRRTGGEPTKMRHEQTQREAVLRMQDRLIENRVRIALRSWHVRVRREKERRDNKKRSAITRMAKLAMARAFNSWRFKAREAARAKGLLRRIVMRGVSKAWSKWHAVYEAAREARAVLKFRWARWTLYVELSYNQKFRKASVIWRKALHRLYRPFVAWRSEAKRGKVRHINARRSEALRRLSSTRLSRNDQQDEALVDAVRAGRAGGESLLALSLRNRSRHVDARPATMSMGSQTCDVCNDRLLPGRVALYVAAPAFACHPQCSPFRESPPGSVCFHAVRARDMKLIQASLGIAAFVSGAAHVTALSKGGRPIRVVPSEKKH